MENFNKWNRLVGWGVFGVAAVVYMMTMEPTASLWDCAEFIATSYKLQIGHPPGAPLWMMIARFFALFAPSPQSVGLMVNAMSALCGAFTVLFLFWSITHLAKKVGKDMWVILGAGAVGALAYCFTDTQWFSAVEAEVYSMSSMFTAMVFWCILKWEESENDKRWLILIAYLMGLSIGVHILNLLCIPAIVLVWYFKKTAQVRFWGVVKALLVAGAILFAINGIIIPYIIEIGAGFDKVFVNGMGMAVNSGLIFWGVVVAMGCVAGLWFSRRRATVHTIMLCLTFILLGYSSYATMLIRAAADPPMNSNDPSNPYTLAQVLGREQYGQRPLLSGPYYDAELEDYKYGTVTWLAEDGRYKTAETLTGYTYAPEDTHLLPRIWNSAKADSYKSWAQIEGAPTGADNMRYFFGYQLNYMYWRYFLWNFVGRQNDIQGDGGMLDGNWLSGVDFIDSAYLGPQRDIPAEMANNKARNKYYFLPFLLGLIGLIYHLGRNKRDFAVVAMLFFMMGIALVLYFNTTPGEPRERDYVYVGSFYAFSIWLGLGVMALREWLFKSMPRAATPVAVVVCACVPLLLACQNWDDHDRSHRHVVSDLGRNALENTLPNSIVMNFGDNDTFPMWYSQEVEGVRPDVRIMNTSYLAGDWYIRQMTRKYNDSEPVPFSLPAHKWLGNANDAVYVVERTEEAVSLRELMDFVGSDNQATQVELMDGEWHDYIPTRNVYLPVNKEAAIRSGIVKAEDAHLMVDSIPITINGEAINKSDLMLLDLLATFDWERPLYFVYLHTLRELGLVEYIQFDGAGYRLVPIRSEAEGGRVDADYLWHNLMEVDHYGNVKDPRVYADYFVNYQFDATDIGYGFVRLSEAMMLRGDTVRAVEALDRAMEEMPLSQIRPTDRQTLPLIQAYYMAGETEKANAILGAYSETLIEYIMYFTRFRGGQANAVMGSLSTKMRSLQQLYHLAQAFDQTELTAPMEEVFEIFDI